MGVLDIFVNNRNVFSAVPVCQDPYKQAIPTGILNQGDNRVVFRTNKGSYSVEQIGRLDVFEVKHMGWGPPDWKLDGRWRRHKIVDDLFECIGRALIPRQASSLYLLATK